MSTAYSAASVIIPAQGGGGKAGTLYGWRPDVNQLQDIDVLRNTTASRVNEAGLIEFVGVNVPRFDWGEGGSCPSLLVEPERTNLLFRSEEFDNAAWVKDAGGTGISPIVSSNAATAPDGTLTADRVTFNLNGGTSSSDRSAIIQTVTTAIGTYTRSVYFKSGDGNNYDIIIATTSAPASFLKVSVTPEWQRFSLSVDATSSNPNFLIGLRNAGGVTGLSDVAVIDCWGAQLEEGSNPTSYIKTEASQATRNADVISKENISSVLPTAYPFTLFAEFEAILLDDEEALSFLDRTKSNVYFTIGISGSGKYRLIARDLTTIQLESISNATTGFHKICGVFTSSELKLFVDGQLLGSTTNTLTFNAGVDDLLIGQQRSVLDSGRRNSIRQAAIYKIAFTDQEAIALTTP